MTVTTPESGLRARVQRAVRGTAVFAIAAGMCGFVAVGTGSAAFAADGDAESVELQLAIGNNGLITPGAPTTASVTVKNDTEDELSTGRVEVELSRTALGEQAAVSTWLDDGEATGEFAAIGSDSTLKVSAGESTTANIAIAPESVAELAPGVYPLRASLDGASTGTSSDDRQSYDTTTHSVLVVSGEQRPQVTVLVPITSTPDDGALLSSDELTELTAADGDLTAQLDGISGTSAVLAVDPAIIAAIRVLGSSAPTGAVDWLERLEALPNERFALQFGDADATTQAQAGLPSLLGPTTLAPFLDAANFAEPPAPTASPTATPTATPVDGEPVLPDDAALTALEGAVSGILWPRSEVTTDDLAVFRSYLGGESTTILSSASLSTPSAGHATVGDEDVLVTDAAASDALSDAAAESDASARAESLAAANAYLFLSAQSATGPLLVGLDRDQDRTSDALRDAVLTADSPGVDLASLRSSTPVTSGLAETTIDARGASLNMLLDDEVTLGAFSSILDDPQVLLSPERIRILRVIRVGPGAEGFSTAVSDHHAATRDTLGAVDIPQSSTIQLLSANADLPFSVRNDLPWPVNIRLTVAPSDPRLDVQSVTDAQIPAGTTTRVKVPVSARVGSGELTLRLSLSSPTGIPLGQDQSVRVAVRAEWETIGLTVFGALIVLLFGLGALRTVHRRRRDRAEAEAASDESSTAEDASTADDETDARSGDPDAVNADVEPADTKDTTL